MRALPRLDVNALNVEGALLCIGEVNAGYVMSDVSLLVDVTIKGECYGVHRGTWKIIQPNLLKRNIINSTTSTTSDRITLAGEGWAMTRHSHVGCLRMCRVWGTDLCLWRSVEERARGVLRRKLSWYTTNKRHATNQLEMEQFISFKWKLICNGPHLLRADYGVSTQMGRRSMRAEGENNRWVERWTKDGKIFYLTKLGSVSIVIKSSC